MFWHQKRHVEMIELNNDGKGLGFGIIGGRSTGVMVKTILPGGAAGRVNPPYEKTFSFMQREIYVYYM